MNVRGLMGLILNIGLQRGVITPAQCTTMTLMASPIFVRLYREATVF